MSAVQTCPRCGAGAMQLSQRLGHVEVFRCESCGWEAAGTFFPASELAHLEHAALPVAIRLKAVSPSVREIMVVRQLLPEYAGRPVAELRSVLRGGAVLCARPQAAAEELQRRARGLGLELLLERA